MTTTSDGPPSLSHIVSAVEGHGQTLTLYNVDAPRYVNLETQVTVRNLAPVIWLQAADGHAAMPPAGGPTELERRHLGEWLACGAP